MKTPESERLLHDVLRDESYLAFTAQLRDRALAEFRQHRRRQRTAPVRALALAATLALLLGLIWLLTPHPGRDRHETGLRIVRSTPLRPEQRVTTARAGQNFSLVPIAPLARGVRSGNLPIVRTAATSPLEMLTDTQLFELFRERPLALVNTDGAHRQLVFLDEGDHRMGP